MLSLPFDARKVFQDKVHHNVDVLDGRRCMRFLVSMSEDSLSEATMRMEL